ncbi:testis development-related protein isoform X2 [Sardina pilchardus]|uniref:testis development-related protein isoform X2 n=1 Tax=Sardina pilchardus TaxID=27697 RepID=UPI002E0E27D7
MFKKSKSQVLVDYASEEDDMSWHHLHSYKESKVKKIKSKKEKKDKKLDDEHFLLTGATLSDKKGKLKEEERSAKPLEREKDKRFWDSITMTMRQITPTRKMDKMEGWEPPQLPGDPGDDDNDNHDNDAAQKAETKRDASPTTAPVAPVASVTPVVPALSLSPPPLSSPLSSPLSLSLPSWRAGVTLEDWRYASLADCTPSGGGGGGQREGSGAGSAVRWAARARGKLAGIRRRSHGNVSENMWEGLK